MTKRKNEISILNVLYCLLVIFIHCTGGGVVSLPVANLSRTVLYALWKLSSFVVQGFVFLSAMKHFMKPDTKSYPTFVLNKIKKIYVPYFLWCVAYYMYYVFFGTSFSFTNLIRGILIGDICGHFYYIVAIMQFYLLFPLWKKLFKKDNVFIVLPVTLLISSVCHVGLPTILKVFFPKYDLMYNDRLFTTYLVYWVLGCYAGLYYQELKNIVLKNKAFISVVFAISGFLAVYMPYMAENYGYYMTFLGDLHMLYCISAILFTLMVAMLIRDTRIADLSLVRGIDRASYGIYLSHCIVLSAVDVLIIGKNGIMPLDATAIRYLTVYPITIAMCLAYGYLKKKAIEKLKNNP